MSEKLPVPTKPSGTVILSDKRLSVYKTAEDFDAAVKKLASLAETVIENNPFAIYDPVWPPEEIVFFFLPKDSPLRPIYHCMCDNLRMCGYSVAALLGVVVIEHTPGGRTIFEVPGNARLTEVH